MTRRCLMRDFIHKSLYSGQTSTPYFAKNVIAPLEGGALPFHTMLGRAEYDQALSRLYQSTERGWATPVEIFTPWYSYAIAEYLLRSSKKGKGGGLGELRVYEVGGGTGRHAINVLDYLKAVAPTLYSQGRVSYTILEISEPLHARQVQGLKAAGHGPAIARSLHLDATRVHQALPVDDRPCTVTALEVLDNLPHDKVVCVMGDTSSSSSSSSSLMETWVEEGGVGEGEGGGRGGTTLITTATTDFQHSRVTEVYSPLRDPLIVEAWELMEEAGRKQSISGGGGDGKGGVFKAGVLGGLGRVCRALPRLPPTLQGPSSPHRHHDPLLPPGFQWALHAPTGALSLLQSLQAALPNHSLLLADFSSFPLPHVLPGTSQRDRPLGVYAPPDAPPGCGGPSWNTPGLRGLHGKLGGNTLAHGLLNPLHAPLIVSSKCPSTRGSVDHGTYLSPPPGGADIMFPTDFDALAVMVGKVAGGGEVSVHHSSDFLRRFGRLERTTTLTGFNPMLETYKNTKFLTYQR